MKRHQDVTRKSGDDIYLDVTIGDDAGAARDISGCTFRWALAASTDGPVLIEKTSAAGITVLDAAGGKIRVEIPAAATADLAGDYVHELELIDASARKSTVLDGRFRLLPDL